MATFDRFVSDTDIKEIIASVFEISLPVSGGWGYSKDTAIEIGDTDLPLAQLEHTLASMRTHLEMNITRPKEERYGSINLNETAREEMKEDSVKYHKVSYRITAMKESEYNAFVDEYKEGYGKEDFDMADHFERRKQATLIRTETCWFRIATLE